MNMSKNRKGPCGWCLVIFMLLALSFASCVHNEDIAYLNDQIVALNKRVARLQESQKSVDAKMSQDLDAKLDQIRTSQASAVADVGQLRNEIQELTGRIEDNEEVVRRAVERDLGEQDAMQLTIEDLSRRITQMEAELKQQQKYLGMEKIGEGEEIIAPKPGPGEGEKPATEPTLAPETEKPAESAAYDNALALYNDGRYEESMDAFEKFIKIFPKSDRGDNAQFWIGESFYSLKQYEKAILAYEEVIKKYKKGNKVPNAMLRQAMAFLLLKKPDKAAARIRLKEIVRKYPQSTEAKIAKQKLKTLKK